MSDNDTNADGKPVQEGRVADIGSLVRVRSCRDDEPGTHIGIYLGGHRRPQSRDVRAGARAHRAGNGKLVEPHR